MNILPDLAGKSVLITGAARRIGAAIAQALHAQGANVAIHYRSSAQSAEKLCAGLNAARPQSAIAVEADLARIAALPSLVRQTVDAFGRLDVLVNNAGGAPYAEAATASPRFSESIIRLNLIAPLNFSQVANRVMQQQAQGGCIINIASVSTIRPSPGTAAYGAAKAGLVNLGTSLAVEWAPKVRVNALVVGLTETEQSHLHYGDKDGIAAIGATIPLGRMAVPADVGNACLFLASPLASYVSGTSFAVHGGGEKPAFLSAANVKQ